MAERRLVLVAHPGDELGFTAILPGADLWVAAPGAGDRLVRESARRLGAVRVHSPAAAAPPGWQLPRPVLEDSLAALDDYDEVYSHDPFDGAVQHLDVLLAAGRRYRRLWVPSPGHPAARLHPLGTAGLARKLELLNTLYPPLSSEPGCASPPAGNVGALEAFAPVEEPDLSRLVSLTHYARVLAEAPDTWAFAGSEYEAARYAESLALLGTLPPPRSVLEIGACEGLMSERLAALFPAAEIVAAEPHPQFLPRLRARLQGTRVRVQAAGLDQLDLDAELVVAAEVLYYAGPELPHHLAALRARWLLTSYHGGFDRELAGLLVSLGWQERAQRGVPVRYETLAGGFPVRRVGATIRLWGR